MAVVLGIILVSFFHLLTVVIISVVDPNYKYNVKSRYYFVLDSMKKKKKTDHRKKGALLGASVEK